VRELKGRWEEEKKKREGEMELQPEKKKKKEKKEKRNEGKKHSVNIIWLCPFVLLLLFY
jgi:hypothetical protein